MESIATSEITSTKAAKDRISSQNRPQNGKSLKIVHLNDYCLQEMCNYLDLIDLINLADANVRLATQAKAIFSQIFQKNRLYLALVEDVVVISMRSVLGVCNEHNRSGYPVVKHRDLKKMFQHFGDCFTKIKVSFEDDHSTKYNVFKMIANYCGETLVELEMSDRLAVCDGCANGLLQKPFGRLEKLTISNINGSSDSLCRCIPKRFPNLRALGFYNVTNITTHFALEQQFAHLEHFCIYTWCHEFNRDYFRLIRSIVKLNPQLRSLGMCRRNGDEHFDDISSITMPNIEKIDISPEFAGTKPPFQFDNLTTMSLINTFSQITLALPRSLQRLELHFVCVDADTVKLLQQCHNVRALKVTLSMLNQHSLGYIQQIAEHMPQLEEIEFRSNCEENAMRTLCFAAILAFINKCKYLTEAHIAYWIGKEECQIRRGKWIFDKSKQILTKYTEDLNQSLMCSRQQWSMKHEVQAIDLMKGCFDDPCFCVTLKRIVPKVE